MKQYVLALDAGTTSSRAILFDKDATIVDVAQQEFTQIYPHPGWVEHDANEIFDTQKKVIEQVLGKHSPQQINSIGITNQRETAVVWNKQTHEPICNAIVWQDRRTAEYCNSIKEAWSKKIQSKTGLVIDAYFSATKLKYILENVEGARTLADQGNLAFGTVDTWLLYKLTQGRLHATDATNASRTMMYNIHTNEWDDELLTLFNIPKSCLPKVLDSSDDYGTTTLFGGEIPIRGVAGDQQSALFGQQCTQSGMVKNTYGTGCFMLMHTGEKAFESKHNLLTTIALRLNGKTQYALEGSVFVAGSLIQWLRDELKMIDDASKIEALARKVSDSGGVFIVPAFAGLGAPHWNQDARGSIFGLTRGSNQSHIARAALESIVYQSAELIDCMHKDSGIEIKELRVDGGAVVNDLMMQLQADCIGVNVLRPKVIETTALGAAYLAGLYTGFFDAAEISKNWKIDQSFTSTDNKNLNIQGFKKAVEATKFFAS